MLKLSRFTVRELSAEAKANYDTTRDFVIRRRSEGILVPIDAATGGNSGGAAVNGRPPVTYQISPTRREKVETEMRRIRSNLEFSDWRAAEAAFLATEDLVGPLATLECTVQALERQDRLTTTEFAARKSEIEILARAAERDARALAEQDSPPERTLRFGHRLGAATAKFEFLTKYWTAISAEKSGSRPELSPPSNLDPGTRFLEEAPLAEPLRATAGSTNAKDLNVREIGLAEWGRTEIAIAEGEMPGLMALRAEFGEGKPLRGAHIAGCLHMTVQTAVLIETLLTLGATVRWSSSNIFSTQDHAAAAVAAAGVPVFAWKGMNEDEFWWCIEQTVRGPGNWTPNMILDDGGDLTLLMHQKYPEMLKDVRGISEETSTGVRRLYETAREGGLLAAAINLNDSVTNSGYDVHERRESLLDNLRHSMGVVGKVAVVNGFGDLGKGSATSLRDAGCRVMVTEADPVCALEAAMGGYQVTTMDEAAPVGDIFVTATGNVGGITLDHMRMMKNRAVLCSFGRLDAEIQINAQREYKWVNVKPHMDEVVFPDGKRLVVLSEGPPVNLGNAGHHSAVMSASYSRHVLAQIELFTAPSGRYERKVYALPKQLEEKVAALHLARLDGLEARLVQEALSSSGYYQGPVDGTFGPQTLAAIRRFQYAIGAETTGALTAEQAGRLMTPQ
jgi:adenosylhomocysteinase